jgi:hypothetical protein
VPRNVKTDRAEGIPANGRKYQECAQRGGSRIVSVTAAREKVAEPIGAHAMDVIFTSCATEGNNAATAAALKANPGKRHIATSQVEHSSVLSYCMALEKTQTPRLGQEGVGSGRSHSCDAGRVATPLDPHSWGREAIRSISGRLRTEVPKRRVWVGFVMGRTLLIMCQAGNRSRSTSRVAL